MDQETIDLRVKHIEEELPKINAKLIAAVESLGQALEELEELYVFVGLPREEE